MASVIRQRDNKPNIECPCGSRRRSRWYYDARNIALFRGCARCAPAKLATYRPEVLTDPNYHADEQIEED